MAQLIDRQEVIKHIESCIDKNGYVDTTKFSDSMRNIFSMSYKTEEQIRADAIEEYKKKIEFVEEWLFDDCKVCEPNVTVAFKTLKHYGEQMQKAEVSE